MDWRILYNPLAVLGKGNGIIAAVIVVVILTAVAYWGGVHLDGALDLHINPQFPSLALAAIESLSAWLSLGLLLFAASKVFGGNGGIGAHLASAGLSRFPYILAAIISSRPVLGNLMLKGVEFKAGQIVIDPQALMLPAIIAGGLAIVGLCIWAVAMLYMGYKESSRLTGGKATVSFIVGLVLAEVISKLIVVLAFNAGI